MIFPYMNTFIGANVFIIMVALTFLGEEKYAENVC